MGFSTEGSLRSFVHIHMHIMVFFATHTGDAAQSSHAEGASQCFYTEGAL